MKMKIANQLMYYRIQIDSFIVRIKIKVIG